MKVDNRRARFDYEILETIEAGIVLSGDEAKAAREGQVAMDGAYVKVVGDEVWLVNMKISPYKYGDAENYDPGRMRKLLLTKKEIASLAGKSAEKRLTLIPVAIYTKGPKVKVEVGLARGKKEYEKREKIQKRDVDRDIEREMK